MGIFSRKKAVPEKKPEKVEERGYIYPGGTFLGLYAGDREPMAISSFFRGIDCIGNTMGSLPLFIEKVDDNGTARKVVHPLAKLLNGTPDKRFSRFNFFKSLVECMLLQGNGYAYIKRNDRLEIEELQLLNPAFVQPMITKSGEVKYIVAGMERAIDATDMIQIAQRYDEMHNGIGLLTYAWRTIETANSAENEAKNFFKTGGNLSGVIKPNANWNNEQRDQVLRSFASSIGTGGAGVALLPPGWDYQAIGVDPTDSQLLDSRKWTVEEIARIIGIPPCKLYSYSSESYNSLEMNNMAYLQDTITPLCENILTQINAKCFPPSKVGKYRVKFDFATLLDADKKSLASYYRELITNGICTINEARSSLGFEPSDVEGTDKHYMQISYSTVDLISSGAYIKQNSQGQNQSVDNNKIETETTENDNS